MKNKTRIHEQKCHVCGFITTANLLARHIKCKHSYEQYIKYKEYLDNRKKLLLQQTHNNSILNSRNHILNCPYCDRKQVNITNMIRHIKNNHIQQLEAYLNNYNIQKQHQIQKNKQNSLNNSSKNIQCKYCGQLFPAKQYHSHLKYKHGIQKYLEYKNQLEQEKQNRKKLNQSKIICPICNQQFYSLNKHILYKHNLSIIQFKQKYPNYKLQCDKRKKKIIKCQFCQSEFKYNNCYMLHLKKQHQIQYLKIKQKELQNKKQKYFQCKICGFKTNQIFQHIFQSHLETWEQYCLKYNHNILEKTYFSLEHRKKLSMANIKNGISNKPNKSYYFNINNDKYPKIIRSYEQFKIISTLINQNIQFEYQNNKILWFDNNGFEHNYIVDLKINNLFFQIKGCSNKKIKNFYSQEKYIKVNQILNKINKKLQIINFNMFLQKFQLNKEIYNENFFIDLIKKLLNDNQITIKYFVINNNSPRLFKKLDLNYINNKNLIILGNIKNDLEKNN